MDQKVGLKPTVARRGPSSRQGPERLAGRLHPRPAPTRAQRRRAHGSLHPMAARAAAGREAVTECAARADETTGRISADSAQPHPPPAPHPRPAAASPSPLPFISAAAAARAAASHPVAAVPRAGAQGAQGRSRCRPCPRQACRQARYQESCAAGEPTRRAGGAEGEGAPARARAAQRHAGSDKSSAGQGTHAGGESIVAVQYGRSSRLEPW